MTALAVAFVAAGCADPPPPVSVPSRDRVRDSAITTLVEHLSPEALAGQLIMVGIENDESGRPLLRLDDATREVLERVGPGAAVLFGQTFAGVEQVLELVADLHASTRIPPIIATDYEGGLVSRLTATGGIPATPIPPARTVGRAVAASGSTGGDDATRPAVNAASDRVGLALAAELGRVMGRELTALGVTMNFAPVADVDLRGGEGAIGRHGRTFGDEPGFVGAVAAAVARGLAESGVAAVVKHFPGHGAVAEDSHDEVAVLDRSADEVREHELRAFELALAAGPAGIMTGHLVVPAIDGTGAPATLSRAVTELAREELRFRGLIITDALNMRALTLIAPEPELVVRAVEAGADMVLKPLDPMGAHEALVEALANGRLERAEVEASVRRIFHAKLELGILGPGWAGRPGVPITPNEYARAPDQSLVDASRRARAILGSADHQAVVERVTELAGGTE